MFDPIVNDTEEYDAYSRFDLSLGVIEEILLKNLRQNNNNKMVNKLFPKHTVPVHTNFLIVLNSALQH